MEIAEQNLMGFDISSEFQKQLAKILQVKLIWVVIALRKKIRREKWWTLLEIEIQVHKEISWIKKV